MGDPIWLVRAHGEMGVEETPGSETTQRIMEYFRSVKGSDWVKDDATPWCGAFMAWAMSSEGYGLPKEPLRARSWLEWGETLKEPRPGCIVILKRGADPAAGHVALFRQWSADRTKLYLLGGNQGDRVSIAVYKASDVLGYRWPKGVSVKADTSTSRIATESAGLVKVGAGVTALGGFGSLPAPPAEATAWLGAWKAVLVEFQSLLAFASSNWLIVGGVAMGIAGYRIWSWRSDDAATGKTWEG